MNKYRLETSTFIAGFCIMTLELTGSRVAGPYVGTSIIVWTSLIGIILASLSIGYWTGGRLADKKPTARILSLLFLYAAADVFFTIIVQRIIFFELFALTSDLRVVTILALTILFCPVSICLGMISPYIIRLRLKTVSNSGQTVGKLSALATIGSIFGTFITGFVLFSIIGTTNILLLINIILTITGIWIYPSWMHKFPICLVLLLLPIAIYFSQNNTPKGIIDIDTEYNRALIFDGIWGPNRQPVRILKLNTELHSAMFLNSPELAFDYTKYYRLAKYYTPDIKSALMIGGGAYSYPKDFLSKEKNATIDVVEIDPKITDIARRYFNLPSSTRLNTFNEDGRTYLNRNTKTYDAIFIDAFQSYEAIPYQLTTVEATKQIQKSLSKNGVVIVNIGSAIKGEKGKFLRAIYRTYKTVFANLAIFPVEKKNDPYIVQNIMLIAWNNAQISNKSSYQEFSAFLSHRYTGTIPEDVPILTDDFAPVDQYIAALMN